MSELEETKPAADSACDVDVPATIRLLSEHAFPLEIGKLELCERGHVRLRDGTAPVAFAFAYLGIDFQVEVETAEQHAVALSARLGRVPFTVESPHNRRFVSRLVAQGGCSPNGRLRVDDYNMVCVEATKVPPAPRTPASIMATVVALLLELKPYLETLGACLPRPAPSAKTAS